MYDRRDRKSPPVYIAEVAVTSQEGGRDKGNLTSALAEGVFLMGAECNADVVRMVSYAPLLANVHGRTELAGAPPPWHGMIYFDSSRVFGTASYYLWKLFAENRLSRTLKTDVTLPANENFKVAGQIGLGTWDTSAEFKDVRVEKNGQAQYTSDFTRNAEGWQSAGRRGGGQWAVTNGVYRQNQPGRASSYFGDESWSDYTLTLKARKLGGGEGFLIMFGRKGGDMYWWNLGGWGNAQHGIELNEILTQVPGHIETGRWYDIRVEVQDQNIKCYLDGKLIHDFNQAGLPSLFASATQDQKSGQMILKVVNGSEKALDTEISLQGAKELAGTGQEIVLTSEHPTDENTLEQPTKVTPKTQTLTVAGPKFRLTFPGNSVTVLRIGARAN
jgi:alpha-L-arabinofuranosidase